MEALGKSQAATLVLVPAKHCKFSFLRLSSVACRRVLWTSTRSFGDYRCRNRQCSDHRPVSHIQIWTGAGLLWVTSSSIHGGVGNSTSIIGVVRSQGADKGEVTDGYSLVRLVCSMATSVDAGCPWSCPSSWCARREWGERSRRTGAFISCLPVQLNDVSRAARFPGGIAKWCRSLSLRANTGG